jgi:hypothetical protein
MDFVLDRAHRTLRDMWNPTLGLFPFTTSVRSGRYVHEYDHPLAPRYTINTLLGLREFAAAHPDELSPEEVRSMTSIFWDKQRTSIRSAGDFGLLLVHLSTEAESTILDEVRGTVLEAAPEKADLQELSWLLWGTSCLAGSDPAAAETARTIFARIVADYLGDGGLARHSPSFYRRNLVSFGSSVYFLRSLYEYGTALGDETALDLFANGARRLMDAQGPRGEWPWMLDVRSGRPTDFYPVFAVHQDGMAMLFLFPAESLGIEGAASATERSIAWCFGSNELDISMYAEPPFVAHRSIERAESLSRARRYLRSTLPSARHGAATLGARVRLNPECRSYHLGWILFAWSQAARSLTDSQNLASLEQVPV